MSKPRGAGHGVGVFGGAFAPFHHGHLRLALESLYRLDLAEVRLVPTAHPPHRPDSRVSPQRRFDWLKLAIRGERGLVADDCELARDGPSYTFDTLTQLRARVGELPIALLIGADAFAHFHYWHRWSEVLDLAHLVVVSRPGVTLVPPLEMLDRLAGRERADPSALLATPAGGWMRLDLPLLDISSTRIRRLLKRGESVRGLVPDAILRSITPAEIALLTQDEDAQTH